MSSERVATLEATPGWKWDSDTWEEQLEHWKTVYTRIQKAPSACSKDKEEKRAGQWRSNQRKAKKTMSAERVATLEATPGWEWGTEREETYTWEEQLEHWKTVYAKIQKAPSSKSKDKEEKRAGQWQSHRRKANKTMSAERITALEATPGWKWGTEREETYTWEEQLAHWKTVYARIQKSPSQHSKDKEEKRAGQWQSHQRTAKKTMSAERITALEAIPGWAWSGR